MREESVDSQAFLGSAKNDYCPIHIEEREKR